MFIVRAVISKSWIRIESWHRQRPDFVRTKDPDFARTGRTRSMGTISTITRAVVALGPRRGVLSGSRVNTFPTPTMSDACAPNVWVALLPFLTRHSSLSMLFLADSLVLVLSVSLTTCTQKPPILFLGYAPGFCTEHPFFSLSLSLADSLATKFLIRRGCVEEGQVVERVSEDFRGFVEKVNSRACTEMKIIPEFSILCVREDPYFVLRYVRP